MFDPQDALEAATEKLAASEVPADVVRLTQTIARLEFQVLRAVGHLDRTRAYEADGSLSAAAWLRHRGRMTHGAAAATVGLARKLGTLPETSAAFSTGEISRPHARVIADACTTARHDEIVALEPELVAAARVTDAHEFRNVVSRVTDAIDGDGGAATAEAQHERRHLHISPLLDGMVAIDGILDREAGEVVVTALRAALDPPARGDVRSAGQRRADALVRVCDAAMPSLRSGPGRARRPHVSVMIDIEVLERRAGLPLVRQVRSDATHLGRLSAATLRRISCDAAISRVITDSPSQPLDVGRTTRTVPASIWRALVARDGGCVADGCDRPPDWCDVHHKQHWVDGGPTNLDNCELRCRRHHRAVHEGAHDPEPP
jgi:Domain of unknown function (DUF222)